MNDKKYLLCLRIKKDGKTLHYKLALASLLALDKYTSFCQDEKELLWYMPNDAPSMAKDTIQGIIANNDDVSFVIRTSLLPGAKTIKTLYKKDDYVLVANKYEITEALRKLLSFSVEDYETGNLPKEKIELLKTAYDNFATEDIKRQMIYNARKRLDPDRSPDLRYETILQTGYLSLGVLAENISLLVQKAMSDYNYKRRLLLFVKDHGANVISPDTQVKERLDYVKSGLELKKESNYYIRKQISSNVASLRSDFKMVRKPALKKKVISYEQEYLERLKRDETKEPTKKYYEAKRQIDLESEIDRLSGELKTAIKVKDEELMDKITRKIGELRYELNSLENGNVSYSDAGFIIDGSLDK